MIYDNYHSSKRFVAVDCVIFGYEHEQLKLLVFKRVIEPQQGSWSLVGGWVKDDESAEAAAQRVLHSITGLTNVYQEQVQTFSNPQRDPGGNVLTVEFYALIKVEKHTNELIHEYGAQWFPLSERPTLIFDHDVLVDKALEKLRIKASYELFGRQLLPERFTLSNLRKLYNEIYQKEFDPGNFRKKVWSLKVLQQLDEKDKSESRKGAYYFKFKDVDEIGAGAPIFNRSFDK